MKVYRLEVDSIDRDDRATVTIGSFDGVHVGHRCILDRLIVSGHSTVVTLDPHPQHVLQNHELAISILTPRDEKVRKLGAMGIERVIIIPFNREFACLSAQSFLKEILIDTIGFKRLVVGYNHSFGCNREGNIEFLAGKSKEYGFELEVIDAQTLAGVAISSTKIRKALREGKLEIANHYLGVPYRLSGHVMHGNSRGRTLGFPTANIKPSDPDQLIPAEGVYAVKVIVDGVEYPGVGSIGVSATFGARDRARVEVHLFDFNMDLYGKSITVEWHEFIRTQKKFADAEELVEQMHRDSEVARRELNINDRTEQQIS